MIVALSTLACSSPLNCVIACQAKLRSKYSFLADSKELIRLIKECEVLEVSLTYQEHFESRTGCPE